jgi:hypothetical protein
LCLIGGEITIRPKKIRAEHPSAQQLDKTQQTGVPMEMLHSLNTLAGKISPQSGKPVVVHNNNNTVSHNNNNNHHHPYQKVAKVDVSNCSGASSIASDQPSPNSDVNSNGRLSPSQM